MILLGVEWNFYYSPLEQLVRKVLLLMELKRAQYCILFDIYHYYIDLG